MSPSAFGSTPPRKVMPRSASASANASSQAPDECRSATSTVTLSPGRTLPRSVSDGRAPRVSADHSTRERSRQQVPVVVTSTAPMLGTSTTATEDALLHASVPEGVQLLTALTLPAGVAADGARKPLATDATGTGAFQFENGIALEQSFGRFLFNFTGTIAWRSVRTIAGTTSQLGPLVSAFTALSYTFPNALSLAASLAYEASFDARQGGVAVADSATAKTTVGLAAAMPLARGVRIVAGFSWTPHLPELGKNELATFGGSLGLVYAWGGPRACPMHPGAATCDCAH